MRILVCMKQVPDTTDIKIDPKTNTLKRDGVPSIMNPDDKTALEVTRTIRLKAAIPTCSVSRRATVNSPVS